MPAAILPLVWREISRLNRRHRLGEKHGCGNSRRARAPRSSTPMSWRARWSNPATKPGPRSLTTFGTAVLQPDRTLDRQKLRAIIFDDPDARKKLESIIHPQRPRAGRTTHPRARGRRLCRDRLRSAAALRRQPTRMAAPGDPGRLRRRHSTKTLTKPRQSQRGASPEAYRGADELGRKTAARRLCDRK